MRKPLIFTVFVSGFSSLAVEMAASRLLGNVFGTSNLVWASIIGLILIYLALGYFLGGYWADRSPHTRTFYHILIWASVMVALVPAVSKPVLRAAADAFDQLQLGILFGSFSAVLVLLFIPITLLGTASPFAIKLGVSQSDQVGRTSGKIYAISTLGSFIGTFLPVLLFIPLIGTYRTFLLSGFLLLVTALICYALTDGWKAILPYLWAPVLVIALWIWGVDGQIKNTTGQVYESESAYNYIQVLEQDGYRFLRLNEGQGIHSVYHPTQLNYWGSWEQVLVGPFFNEAPYLPEQVDRIAVVGLAAGTTARQATLAFEDVVIDGWEIDPEIVKVGREYFDMNEPNLNVYVQDGRWGLEKSEYLYDIISVDAYRPPYIPYHMTTQEFFQIARDHLTEQGVLVINVGRGNTDRRLINSLGSTILSVFPSVHVVDIPNTFNSIIFATNQPTSSENLQANLNLLLQSGDTPQLLLESVTLAAQNLQGPVTASQVFTDDKAPIEWITNTMVMDFLFSDDMTGMQ